MTDTPPVKKEMTPWQAMGIVWDLMFDILVPVVLFALLGRWLDRRYGTTPLFIAISLIFALAVTIVIVTKKGRSIAKQL